MTIDKSQVGAVAPPADNNTLEINNLQVFANAKSLAQIAYHLRALADLLDATQRPSEVDTTEDVLDQYLAHL